MDLEDFERMLPEFDVLYLNRLQREIHRRRENSPFYMFKLSEEHLSVMKEDAIILNPGPRLEEMYFTLEDPRIKFWDQVRNGLYIRMAILRHIFGCNV